MNKEELSISVARVEESTKSAHKRIDTLEENMKNIYSLANDVKSLAGDVRVFAEQLTTVKKDVGDVKSCISEEQKKPGKMIDSVKISIINGIAMIVISAIMALIIK